ncbi:MAG: ComF family protein [Granulosicoccus sp.]|jgi:ComF family protein
MHFYMQNFKEMVNLVMDRLKIGSYCILCNRPGCKNLDICSDCDKWLSPRIFQKNSTSWHYLCVTCGSEQVQNGLDYLGGGKTEMKNDAGYLYSCSSCQNIDGVFHRIVAPYRYEFPIDHIISRMKYGQRRVFGRVLGGLLAASVKRLESLPDVLVPVPLHTSRQVERGYNQAADIARWCAVELDLQCKPTLVSRVFDTGSLTGLSKAARQLRILGAFRASPEVRGCRIAIVDDVLTTGATARELARELYDTGALSVELWVLARTSSDR